MHVKKWRVADLDSLPTNLKLQSKKNNNQLRTHIKHTLMEEIMLKPALSVSEYNAS